MGRIWLACTRLHCHVASELKGRPAAEKGDDPNDTEAIAAVAGDARVSLRQDSIFDPGSIAGWLSASWHGDS